MRPELTIEGWPIGDWSALTDNAGQATVAVAPELANSRLCTSLLFTSDTQVRALNREWRERDKPTNVLSFPMLSRKELIGLTPGGPPVMLGDIAFAFETCEREAADKAVALPNHVAHLIVHGLLHLAGYDHETSPREANAMEALEIRALATMGISNPYRVDD